VAQIGHDREDRTSKKKTRRKKMAEVCEGEEPRKQNKGDASLVSFDYTLHFLIHIAATAAAHVCRRWYRDVLPSRSLSCFFFFLRTLALSANGQEHSLCMCACVWACGERDLALSRSTKEKEKSWVFERWVNSTLTAVHCSLLHPRSFLVVFALA
jgi:hypothetical protein